MKSTDQLFTDLFGPEGSSIALLHELATLKIESDFRSGLTSKTGAQSPYQILPSTAAALAKKYGLAPISFQTPEAEWVTSRNYYVAHLNEDVALVKTKGIPPLVEKMFPNASADAKRLLALRYYYHNGSSWKVHPSAVEDLPLSLNKFQTYITHYAKQISKT